MNISEFLEKLKNQPTTITFEDTMAVIEANYDFTPTAFTNGETTNAEGQNSGSCKLFAFAQLQKLDQQNTLYCFGQYYKDVTDTPEETDHQNIRNFIKYGWSGISFEGIALVEKS